MYSFTTSCRITDGTTSSSPGFWLVPSTSRIISLSHALTPAQNHSCVPNCWMKNVVINEHTKRKSVLALFTLETVEENEELHFSYFGSLDEVRGFTSIIALWKAGATNMILSGDENRGARGRCEWEVLLRLAKMYWHFVPANHSGRRKWRRSGK